MADELYPQSEKLLAKKDEHMHVQQFLEWLDSEGITLANWEKHKHDESCGKYHDLCSMEKGQDYLMPHNEGMRVLLMRYLEIDENALENERRAMLDALRQADGG